MASEPEQPADAEARQRARRALLETLASGGGQPPRRPRRLTEGKPYDPEPLREETRSKVAYALVGLLISVSLLLIGFTATDLLKIDETKDLALAILSPVVAITGTVFGFYYGGHRRGQ
jgi:hypothetical protein